MTFWDVRPLVKDRLNAPHEQARLDGTLDAGHRLFANDLTTGCRVYGSAMSTIAGYRAGGAILDGAGLPIDLQATTLREPGYAPAAGGLWYLYAVFPAGLPRWVRYAATPPRIPAGPLGVLVLSSRGPASIDNNALASIVFAPTSTGLVASGAAVVLAAGIVNSSGAGGELGGNARVGGLWVFSQSAEFAAVPIAPDGSSTSTEDRYRLIANQHFPLCARSVLVALNSGGGGLATVCNQFAPGAAWSGFAISGLLNANVPALEIPTVADGPSNGLASANIEFAVSWTSGSRTGQGLVVVGWRL